MGWRTVAHNVALHLGSWLVGGMEQEFAAMDSQPESYSYEVEEPEIVDIPSAPAPYTKFYIRKLVERGAWGFDGRTHYFGHDLRYMEPTMLLALPGTNGDMFFRIAKITDATMIVVCADYELKPQQQWEPLDDEGYEVFDWPQQQGQFAY